MVEGKRSAYDYIPYVYICLILNQEGIIDRREMPEPMEEHTFGCVYEGDSRGNRLRVKTPPACSQYPPSDDLDSQTKRRGQRREPAEYHKSLLYSLVYRAGRVCNHASCLM